MTISYPYLKTIYTRQEQFYWTIELYFFFQNLILYTNPRHRTTKVENLIFNSIASPSRSFNLFAGRNYRFVFGLRWPATRLVKDRMVTNSSAADGCIPTYRGKHHYIMQNSCRKGILQHLKAKKKLHSWAIASTILFHNIGTTKG